MLLLINIRHAQYYYDSSENQFCLFLMLFEKSHLFPFELIPKYYYYNLYFIYHWISTSIYFFISLSTKTTKPKNISQSPPISRLPLKIITKYCFCHSIGERKIHIELSNRLSKFKTQKKFFFQKVSLLRRNVFGSFAKITAVRAFIAWTILKSKCNAFYIFIDKSSNTSFWSILETLRRALSYVP